MPGSVDSSGEDVRISIVAFDDFTDIDLILVWDLLNRVHLPGWNVSLVGDGPFHRSMTGLTIPMHGPLSEANTADAVLFTSGKGTRAKIRDADYLAQFQLNPERQLIGSVDSGALLLAALGLLDGKRATTYPSAKPLLEQYGVWVVEEPLVIDGNVATAGGCMSGQYLAHWVMERLVGKPIADAVITSWQPVGEGLFFSTDVEAAQAR
ncbi:DJ-1/PfpI family protein [Ralstonia sp. Ralssp135]|uniref:DJ-1/PfpI family protein n=1 Tax=Ralstonia sp. Ralssp135 TaxID=3243016 RepID=UPI0039AF30B8